MPTLSLSTVSGRHGSQDALTRCATDLGIGCAATSVLFAKQVTAASAVQNALAGIVIEYETVAMIGEPAQVLLVSLVESLTHHLRSNRRAGRFAPRPAVIPIAML